MQLKKLLRSVVVIPAVDGWQHQTLGLGSIIGVPQVGERVKYDGNIKINFKHPLGVEHELLIAYRDVAGRLVPGWIDPRHPMNTVTGRIEPKTVGWLPQTGGSLTDLDFFRGYATMANQPLVTYIAVHGAEPQKLTELKGVIRELGGKTKDSDDPDTVIRRALRLILSREVTMAEVQEARETAKKSGKKAARKAADREVERTVEREPSARGGTAIGETLVKLGVGGKLAKRLAKGETLKKKELQALRDEINAAAVEARENNKGKLASQLSAANRTIRRMARAA